MEPRQANTTPRQTRPEEEAQPRHIQRSPANTPRAEKGAEQPQVQHREVAEIPVSRTVEAVVDPQAVEELVDHKGVVEVEVVAEVSDNKTPDNRVVVVDTEAGDTEAGAI